MGKRKITESERRVLERLIFPERFQVVLEETGHLYGELRDDLINLLSYGFIEAYERDNKSIAQQVNKIVTELSMQMTCFFEYHLETGHLHGELRDDLINLLSYGFIEAYERDNNKIALTAFYDADNLQDFTFRATSKGLSEIKSN